MSSAFCSTRSIALMSEFGPCASKLVRMGQWRMSAVPRKRL